MMTSECAYTFDHESTTDDTQEIPQDWSCSRSAHPDSEFCEFHTPLTERDTLDISQEDITDALQTVAENEGKAEKQLIGAQFHNIDLQSEILTAPDKYRLDLRGAVIEGTLDLSGAKIEQPLDLRGITVQTIEWSEAIFTESLSAAEMTADGECTVTGTEFQADVDLRDASFGGRCVFDEARFYGDTCLRSSVFNAPASFDGVEFQGDANLVDDDACFENVVFASRASFRKAKFRYADFVSCVFNADAEFDETTFSGDAEFTDVAFHDNASFRGATFEGDADVLIDDANFESVEFQGPATFEAANFAFISFEGSRFADSAQFKDAVFDDDAIFSETTFVQAATFTEGRFRADADFTAVTFKNDATFRGVEFQGGDNIEDDDVTFADATFAGDAMFEHARFRYATFTNAVFEQTATFGHTQFSDDAIFSEVMFTGQADFVEGRFGDDTSFAEATFEASATFRGAEFIGGANVTTEDLTFEQVYFNGDLDFRSVETELVSFEQAHFEALARFDETSFNDEVCFKNAQFVGETIFDECRFRSDADFGNSIFEAETTFDGVEFHGGDNVRDDDITFAESIFKNGVSFDRARFTAANFYETTFNAEADFTATRFSEHSTFEGATFEVAKFSEAQFGHDVDFTGITVTDCAQFAGVEVEGGLLETDDAAFEMARFEGPADFEAATFRDVGFQDVEFTDDVCMRQAIFRGAEFDQMTVQGEADLCFAKFDETASFVNVVFEGTCSMDEVRFGSDANFANAMFEDGVSLKGAEFTGGAHTVADANFRAAEFGGTVTFKLAEFRTADYSGARFEDTALFIQTVFAEKADFQNADFKQEAIFSHSLWHEAVDFSNCTFDDGMDGTNAEFHEAVTFNDAVFGSVLTFTDASFGATVDFDPSEFGATVDFTNVSFEGPLTLNPITTEPELIIEFEGAFISGGELGQAEDGDVFYDCTDARILDVKLDNTNCTHGLFNHFQFFNTDFDGFDFTQHKEELARQNWIIHEFAANYEVDDEYKSHSNADLEETYLKAKNCASDFGDRKAAAEFFVKEMVYRRRKNFDVARDANESLWRRGQAFGKWLGNNILHQTCGYGERLWRVVYVSTVAIVFWGILFATVGDGTRGQSQLTTEGLQSFWQLFSFEGISIMARNLYFSLVTFTTLGYGDIQPVGATASILAGLEAFFGAMLVALVVFVLGRRVAW